VICMDMRTNSDYFFAQHSLIVLITEADCVYSAVRTESLWIIRVYLRDYVPCCGSGLQSSGGRSLRVYVFDSRSADVRFVVGSGNGTYFVLVIRGFPLSVSFNHCATLHIIYVLRLPQRQKGLSL